MCVACCECLRAILTQFLEIQCFFAAFANDLLVARIPGESGLILLFIHVCFQNRRRQPNSQASQPLAEAGRARKVLHASAAAVVGFTGPMWDGPDGFVWDTHTPSHSMRLPYLRYLPGGLASHSL